MEGRGIRRYRVADPYAAVSSPESNSIIDTAEIRTISAAEMSALVGSSFATLARATPKINPEKVDLPPVPFPESNSICAEPWWIGSVRKKLNFRFAMMEFFRRYIPVPYTAGITGATSARTTPEINQEKEDDQGTSPAAVSSPESDSIIDTAEIIRTISAAEMSALRVPISGATCARPKINPEKVDQPAVPSPESNSICAESPWIASVRKQLNSAAANRNRTTQWTIFRVPEHIRRGDPKAYEPLVVWIGPYHHHNAPRGSNTIHDHKLRCVCYLLSRHRNPEQATKLLIRCLSELKALDAKVRSCYSDKVHFGEEDLALAMLLDGCFIINLLMEQPKTEEVVVESRVVGNIWIWNLVAYDLLKLENQIPFFVVQTLFNKLATDLVEKGVDLLKLALQLFGDIHPNMSKDFTSIPKSSDVHHLLHLFHLSLFPSQQPVCAKSPPEWIPSATELMRSGIKFKTNKAAKSFLDVSFEDGIMLIPQLPVYDYTNLLFRNLIAFEQCYPDTTTRSTYITFYAAFMDCIIDNAEDVKLLDLKRILVNRLSTDEAVADLFNKLCDQIHYDSDKNYLADMFVRVTKYHASKWPRWRAALIRDYFSSPWAGVAVVAAILLFLLTIEQSVLAAISYFRPP